MFVRAMTARFRAEVPQSRQTDILKRIGEMWRGLTAKEKNKYIALGQRRERDDKRKGERGEAGTAAAEEEQESEEGGNEGAAETEIRTRVRGGRYHQHQLQHRCRGGDGWT